MYLCAVLQPIAWSFLLFLVSYFTLALLESSCRLKHALHNHWDWCRRHYYFPAHTQRPLREAPAILGLALDCEAALTINRRRATAAQSTKDAAAPLRRVGRYRRCF